MRHLFVDLSERAKLFIVSLLICIPAILISYFLGGAVAMIAILCFIIFLLYLTRGIWLSKDHAKYSLIRYTVASMVAAVSFPQWQGGFSGWVNSLLAQLFPNNPYLVNSLTGASPYFLFTLFTIFLVLVNYFLRDKTGMVKHMTPIDEEFPEINYRQQFQRFCRVIHKIIDDLDLESNWSVEDFTPLEAQVEIRTKSGRRKKITDLLYSIKSDHKSKVFLVLGDPGSGKSVALRKLCKDLLREAEKTGKIPIYINLKEWYISEKWTIDNLPSARQLIDFILSQLKGKDVFADDFLNKYFHKMMECGRFFFILDSFDEIPMVLDETENSWLIDKISEVIYYVLAGANDSRGVLASRFFRKPTSRFDAKTTLFVRPFNDSKIYSTLTNTIRFDDNLIKELFNIRIELIPVARNPFTNSLLCSYAKKNSRLPSNQADMYHDYIQGRLETSLMLIEEGDLTIQTVLSFCAELASFMFKSEKYGMEIPMQDVILKFGEKSHKIIDVLVYSRLGRVGKGHLRKFSFVHRRFNEYFVTTKLLELHSEIPIDSIPEDSRWRDAMVLFCEVAPIETAKHIANYCWKEVETIEKNELDLSEDNLPQYLRAMHSIRFLCDAYKGRKQCLSEFADNLYEFVKNRLSQQKKHTQINLLEIKLTLEATGLLEVDKIEEVIPYSFTYNDSWITETAINACKHLPKLNNVVQFRIKNYFDQLPDFSFFKNYHEITASLKYSESLKNIYKFSTFRYTVNIAFYLLLGLLLLFNPMMFLMFASVYYLFHFTTWFMGVAPLYRMLSLQIDALVLSIILLTQLDLKMANNDASQANLLAIIGDYKNTLNAYRLFYFKYFILCFYVILPIRLMSGIIFDLVIKGLRFSLPELIEFIRGFIYAILIPLFILFFPFFIILRLFPLYKNIRPYFETAFEVYEEFILLIVEGYRKMSFKTKFFACTYILLFIFEILRSSILKTPFSMVWFCILLAFTLFPIVQTWIMDKIYFEKLKNKLKDTYIPRLLISQEFKNFRTKNYRYQFVLWLSSENKIATGYWENGQIPYKRDKASSLLAQLEEKWLKLD